MTLEPIDHLGLAKAINMAPGILAGYQAACACGWKGQFFSLFRVGPPEARTLARMAAENHVTRAEADEAYRMRQSKRP